MIKTSSKLDQLMNDILDIDFLYIDEILSNQAAYYSIADKADTEDGFTNGVRLCLVAQKKKKPIWAVYCDDGSNSFTAYFIRDLQDISKMLKSKLKKARSANEGEPSYRCKGIDV